MHTTSFPPQRCYSQPYTSHLNPLTSPSPLSLLLRSLSSINMHNLSPRPLSLNSPAFMGLPSINMNNPLLSFPPFSRNFSHGVATDSVKKEWFEAVTKDDLATRFNISSQIIFLMWMKSAQKGDTAFLMACDLQNKSIATYLLSIGANKFVQNNDGGTAFHFSCMHGKPSIYRLVVRRRPRPT